MNVSEIIRAIQKALGIGVDGYAGPETWQAIYNRIVANAPLTATSDKVDDRSEKVIATLLPDVQPSARALVTKAAANGITIKVISGAANLRRTKRPLRAGTNETGQDRDECTWRTLESQFWDRVRRWCIRRRPISRRISKV